MRGLSIVLLVVGVILLVLGFNASESLASEFKETFTGTPTNESVWMLVGGAVLLLLGGVTLFRGRRP